MMKIAICVPDNHPSLNKRFVQSLLGVTFTYFTSRVTDKYKLNFYSHDQGWIDFMREALAVTAIEKENDYILWLDSDMTFPPDLIERMTRHFEEDNNLEAVSGLYTFKQPPFMPHAYTSISEDNKFLIAGAFPTRKAFEIKGAGFGCLMMKTSVFKRLERPWFKFEIGSHGEDLGFCLKAKMKMLLDPTIRCTHIAQNEFGLGEYLEYNQLKLDEAGNIEATQERLNEIADEHVKIVPRAKKPKVINK